MFNNQCDKCVLNSQLSEIMNDLKLCEVCRLFFAKVKSINVETALKDSQDGHGRLYYFLIRRDSFYLSFPTVSNFLYT